MEKLVIFAVLIYFVTCQSVDDCPAALPRDNTLRAFGDSCFQFVTAHQRTHSQAKQECETNGGHLALIKSQAIQDFIYHSLTNDFHDTRSKLWIGLNDIDKEDEFKWEDGTPLAYSNFDQNQGPNISTITHNWSKDENDCVLLDLQAHGKWIENACELSSVLILFAHSSSHPFICQYFLGPAGETTGADVSGMPGTTVVVRTNPCPAFSCALDCGANGFKKDPNTECFICQCTTR